MARSRGNALIASALLLVWACAKATDSDLGGSVVAQAGKGGAGGTTTGKGGTGGSTAAGTGGSSAASNAGKAGTGTGGTSVGGSGQGGSGNGAGRGGTGGSTGGTQAQGGQAGDDGIPPDVLKNADVVIYYAANIASVSANAVEPHLYFQNKSDDALDLTHVTLRYWMTTDGASYGNLKCYYAAIGTGNVSLAFVDDGDDSHVEITFSAGQISPHNSDIRGTQVQMKLDAQGGDMFNQANDWSFDGTLANDQNPQPNLHVTAYLGDKLVWGCEPSGTCAGEGGAGGQGGQAGQAGQAGEGSGGTSAGQGGQGGEALGGQGGS